MENTQAEQKDTKSTNDFIKRHILETSESHEEWEARIEALAENNTENM